MDKNKKEKAEDKDRAKSNDCFCYVDPCGCYMVDPCGCYYVNPCCC